MRPARPWPLLLVAALSCAAYGFQGRDESALVAERDDAIEQVKRIVNAPAPSFPLNTDVQLGQFSPGWFHDGAARPAFLTVDVRASQQFPYDQWEYVTSDVNPGLMFRGSDLEFNSMTKYFYTDRTLPKKRLGPDEMAEVNRLYRIIGAREQDLRQLHAGPAGGAAGAPPAAEPAAAPRPKALYVAGGVLLVLLAVLVARRAGQ